jgi:Na+/melibiose symporter-like transporter
MNEIVDIFQRFAATTTGKIVLAVVGLGLLLLILPPLWRSVKYLFKALMWGLLVIVVLALAAGGIWLWVKRSSDDPAKMEALEQKAYDSLHNTWTNQSDAAQEEPAHEDSAM